VNREILKKINRIPQKQIFAIRYDLSLEQCALAYQESLEKTFQSSPQFPQFDLILLGMGPDGHTCSLFPHHPLLKEKKAWIAYVADSPKPPPKRITFTLPVVNNARCVAFVVTGSAKSDVVQKILEPAKEQGHSTTASDEEIPSRLVNPSSKELYWFMDCDAASKLSKVKCLL